MEKKKKTDSTIDSLPFTAAELRDCAARQQENHKKLAKEALINIIAEKITKDANIGYLCSTFSYADFSATYCRDWATFKMIKEEIFALYRDNGFDVKPADADRWGFMVSWR